MTQLKSRSDEMGMSCMRADMGLSLEIAYTLPSPCQAGM